jgi:hypothetical protein
LAFFAKISLMNNKNFRLRVFVSFFLLFSFLLSAVSGIVLFLRPEGSLAAWTGWSALWLDKKEWEAVHAVAIFFFFLCAAVHLAYNWRALFAYCRRRWEHGKGSGRFRELIAALLLSGMLLIATLGKWFPVQWIVDLRGVFKGGAAVVKVVPPVPDAEKLTLAEFGPRLGMDDSQLLAAACAAGIQVEALSQTLAEVAEKNHLTPEKVFILLKK